MSFLVSKSLEHRLDEKTFLKREPARSSEEIHLLTLENLKKIKRIIDKKTLITFFCDKKHIDSFLDEKIKIIKFRNLSFNKLKTKQIIIKKSKYFLKILCEENSIENIRQ